MSEMLEWCRSSLRDKRQLIDVDPIFEFYIHEHRATSHHFDFSLRIGDQLATWAMSSGPSTDPRTVRDITETTPHDSKYARHERFIPAGQKGSGPKMVWDFGLYRFEGQTYFDVIEDLKNGHLSFQLDGSKLKGGWTLQQTSGLRWTLTKIQDEFASERNILEQDRSPISGKRLKDFELGPAAWVELQGFYVAKHPSTKPLIVLKDGYVLDANSIAASLKVETGMPERMAKNLVNSGEFIPWTAESYVPRQHEWLDICLTYTDAIEPVDQHSAFLDFKLHPQPLETLDDLRQNLYKRLKLTPLVGLAQAKWIAQLAAHSSHSQLAFNDPERFVAKLPISLLKPALPEHRSTLEFLGCSTIEQVATLSQSELHRRFGSHAFAIHQAARGSYVEQVKHGYPPDSFADRFVFQGAVDCGETILESVRAWSKTLGKRLQAKSLEGARVCLLLEFEQGEVKAIQRTFAKPVSCRNSILGALQLMIENQIDRPLVSMRILLPELHKVDIKQMSLFGQEKLIQHIQPSLKHVRTVFGDKSVELASQREEPRRTKVLKMWKHATGWQ